MKIAGIILIAIGAVDVIGSFVGFDLWVTIGVPLPEIVWKFSAYIEIALGYFLLQQGLGSKLADSGEKILA